MLSVDMKHRLVVDAPRVVERGGHVCPSVHVVQPMERVAFRRGRYSATFAVNVQCVYQRKHPILAHDLAIHT